VKTLRVDPVDCQPEDLTEAVGVLKAGGVVAFPTDTFYGLAVDPTAASRAQVTAWCGLEGDLITLADAFWPGPLSLICNAPKRIAPGIHAGLGTVAVRVPAHAVARSLAYAWGNPVPASSANLTGQPPAVSVDDLSSIASDDLLVIDGGPAAGGAPSTIVDARKRPPALVREGAIPWDRVLHSLLQR
jgi:L-threonylcarbamoyladenylate synthase